MAESRLEVTRRRFSYVARNDWLCERRRCRRTRPLILVDVVVFLLIESENRRGPGCQLAVATMARRLDVSESTVRRSLARWRDTNLVLELWRPGLLPKLRLSFHPFDRDSLVRARRIVEWHANQLGEDWLRRARAYLANRSSRIESARLSIRRTFANRRPPPFHPPPRDGAHP